MAIITRPLTNFEVKNAKPKNKEYALYDGNGLMLTIKPNGNKIGFIVINVQRRKNAP